MEKRKLERNIKESANHLKYEATLTEIKKLFPELNVEEFYNVEHIVGAFLKAKNELSTAKDRLLSAKDEILETLRVPKRLRGAKKQDIDPKIWKKATESESIFIYGPAGTGKSYLVAALIANQIDEYKPEIITHEHHTNPKFNVSKFSTKWAMSFVPVPDLLLSIRSTFQKDSESSEEEVIDELTTDKPRAFDDLGAEKTSEWSLQTLYTIIDRRYREEQKTIFTSNLSIDGIGEKLGDRIASRIVGMCCVIELKGRDRRIGRPL
jgi:DNA replication protein DnaC